jgi:hypothetical protein
MSEKSQNGPSGAGQSHGSGRRSNVPACGQIDGILRHISYCEARTSGEGWAETKIRKPRGSTSGLARCAFFPKSMTVRSFGSNGSKPLRASTPAESSALVILRVPFHSGDHVPDNRAVAAQVRLFHKVKGCFRCRIVVVARDESGSLSARRCHSPRLLEQEKHIGICAAIERVEIWKLPIPMCPSKLPNKVRKPRDVRIAQHRLTQRDGFARMKRTSTIGFTVHNSTNPDLTLRLRDNRPTRRLTSAINSCRLMSIPSLAQVWIGSKSRHQIPAS